MKKREVAQDRANKDAALAVRDAYVEDAKAFVNWLDARGLALNYSGLVGYVDWLNDQEYAAATVNKRLCGAKNRIRTLFVNPLEVLKGFELEQALKKIKPVKRNTAEVDLNRVLSLEEVQKLLAAEAVPRRTKLFVEVLVRSGLRVSELINIHDPGDLERIEDHFVIRIRGKGRKERKIRLAVGLVSRVRAEFPGSVYLFERTRGRPFIRQYVSHQIRLAGAAVINRRIAAHTMRHTFATLQIKATRKVKAVSLYLGHSSTAITQDMYLHEQLEDDDLDIDLTGGGK